jgi:hypothetical protein
MDYSLFLAGIAEMIAGHERGTLIVLFLFVGLFLLRLGDDISILIVGLGRCRRGLRFAELRLLGLLDHAAATVRRDDRSLFRVALIGATFRTERLRLAEIVELRMAAITGIFSSQIRHASTSLPFKSGAKVAPDPDHVNEGRRASNHLKDGNVINRPG